MPWWTTSPYRLTASSIVSPIRAKEVTLSPRRRALETNRFVTLGAMEIGSQKPEIPERFGDIKKKTDTLSKLSVLVRRPKGPRDCQLVRGRPQFLRRVSACRMLSPESSSRCARNSAGPSSTDRDAGGGLLAADRAERSG